MLQVFGLSRAMEGRRHHLIGSGVFSSSHEACTATTRDVMNREHTIVVRGVSVCEEFVRIVLPTLMRYR